MALVVVNFPLTEKNSKIVEWKVKTGSLVSKGRVLLHYQDEMGAGPAGGVQKFKASQVGTVKTVLVPEGSCIKPGDALLEIESCSHPTVMRDLCAECGADLSNEKQIASVPMVHCVPELKVSVEQAQRLGKADEEQLLQHRKLVLLVDLDQTLIHTTNDDVPPNLKDVHHFQLYGKNSPWYHTRLRPITNQFLHSISDKYELHICTFGARSYAHTIASILDPDQKLFSHRILSRDECFDPNSKTANLSALFPCGDHMVCIIDDREDVWNFAPNLIAVKPYHFFQHTGDIHAPPGLDKHEQDGSGYTPDGGVANTASSSDPEEKSGDVEPAEPSEDAEKEDKMEETDAAKSTNEVETKAAEGEISTSTSEETPTEKTAVNSTTDDTEVKADTSQSKESDVIVVNDPDDYLLHLQEILYRIHIEFYERYDATGEVPNMRDVVPGLKRKVLANQSIVFSGVVPTHVPLASSRSAQVARSLGARVTDQVLPGETTHLVAARPGTAKVNEARRAGTGIHIVSPDWLLCTAERWERAEERLFPLSRASKRQGIQENKPRLSTASIADSINPLLSFSSEDLKSMDQEVEDIFNETDDESAMDRDVDSSDDEAEEEEEDEKDSTEAAPVIVAKKEEKTKSEENTESESLKRQLEIEQPSEEPTFKLFKEMDYSETPTSDPDEDLIDSGDESELSKMGMALEREFLAE